MRSLFQKLKPIVAATLFCLPAMAYGQDRNLDDLFTALQTADADGSVTIVEKIADEWSKSGSPAMDLLLRRGHAALDNDDPVAAIHHFTALTDHAPDFAEGWHSLGLAYYSHNQIGPALAAIERTLALEPRHFLAMEGMMVILEQNGLPDLALQMANMIQAIHPQHPELEGVITRLETQIGGRTL